MHWDIFSICALAYWQYVRMSCCTHPVTGSGCCLLRWPAELVLAILVPLHIRNRCCCGCCCCPFRCSVVAAVVRYCLLDMDCLVTLIVSSIPETCSMLLACGSSSLVQCSADVLADYSVQPAPVYHSSHCYFICL